MRDFLLELERDFEAQVARYADEARRLKMPDGSTAHMCANVWRVALTKVQEARVAKEIANAK